MLNVVFLRTVFSDKTVSLSFILGKARVAPIKRMTTPNLELLAATNRAKLAQFIKGEQNLSFDTIAYWTDSTTVLSWINSSESRHKFFSANRISIILSTSTVSQWRYVPTDLNPADDGTRGTPVLKFTSESRWLKGPDFLLKNPETWSERPSIAPECPNSCFPLHPIDAIVSFQNFSQRNRLLKTVAFCYSLLEKHRRINDRLGVVHLMKAFRWILLETQRTLFPEEINALRNQKPPASNSRISSLCPFLDRQGILRSRGRLSKAKYLLVACYPIILDSKHPAVKLFLLHIHKSNSHASLEQSRSIVQEQFWVLRCRFALKTIIHHCIPCSRITSTLTIRSWLIYLIVAYLPRTNFHFLQQDSISMVRFPSKTMANSRVDFACYLLALSQGLFISKLVLILIQRQPSWHYVVSFLYVEIHNKLTLTLQQLSSKLVKN